MLDIWRLIFFVINPLTRTYINIQLNSCTFLFNNICEPVTVTLSTSITLVASINPVWIEIPQVDDNGCSVVTD